MAEVQRRQRVTLKLPEELVTSLLTHRTKRDIVQNVLDSLLGAGVDISSPTAGAFIQGLISEVTEISLAYNADMLAVLSLAQGKAGYDPEKCTEIQDDILETSGAVFWMGPVRGAA